jgi:protein TonB
MISNVNVAGDPAVHAPVAPAGPVGVAEVAAVVAPVIDKIIPVDHPEVQPSYPGGIDALRKFLERNLVNPKEMEEGEMVSVNVSFVVGFDGKLQRFAVVKDGGDIFNREVIRVLKKMPDWVPGKSRGENVAVNFTIPIKFVPAD